MMTEIQTIEGGQKDISTLEETTLKKILADPTWVDYQNQFHCTDAHHKYPKLISQILELVF